MRYTVSNERSNGHDWRVNDALARQDMANVARCWTEAEANKVCAALNACAQIVEVAGNYHETEPYQGKGVCAVCVVRRLAKDGVGWYDPRDPRAAIQSAWHDARKVSP